MLVSIITPTYNRPQLLKCAIESVLSQNYKNFEHIIINDGGVDVSPIVDIFNDKRLKLINLKKNYGRSIVRNIGLKHAKGDIIAYLDDDVLFLPNHLSLAVDFLKKNWKEFSACFTANYYTYEDIINGKRIIIERKKRILKDINFDNLFVSNFIDLNSLVHKRELYTKYKIQFNPVLKVYVDWDFVLNIIKNKLKIKYIPKITHDYRIRLKPDNVSHPKSSKKYILHYTKLIYKFHPVNNKEIEEKRIDYLQVIKKIKNKIYYINHLINNKKPNKIILVGSPLRITKFNYLILNFIDKINFIIDFEVKKDYKKKCYGIRNLSIKRLKEILNNDKDKDGTILFIINHYDCYKIYLFKRKIREIFGKDKKIYITLLLFNNWKQNEIWLKRINKSKKITIFGLGKSGKMTYEFIKKYYPEKIKYFIDDNVKGEYESIPIVTTDEFLEKYQYEVDIVVFGKYQHLNPKLLPNLKISYLRLDNIV